MLSQQTITQLNTLKNYGMARAYEQQLSQPDMLELSFDQRLGMLTEAELYDREQRKQDNARRAAKLSQPCACLEDINYGKARGLDKSYLHSLSHCQWLARYQNVLITGLTGVGKSYLANALAQQAIRQGYRARFYRVSRLLEELDIARLDGSLAKLRIRLLKFSLLILDDWALAPLSDNNRQDLLEIIEDRVEKGSLIITSQLPISQWHEYIGEPTLADAIMDRLIHRSHCIELSGESMRKHYKLED